MTKIRIHQIAKDLEIESKEIIRLLTELGITGKTVTSGLEDHEIASLKSKINKTTDQAGEKKPATDASKSTKTQVEPIKEAGQNLEQPSIPKTHHKQEPRKAADPDSDMIKIYEGISLTDLAHQLDINPLDIMDLYIQQGLTINSDDRLKAKDAKIIATRYGFKSKEIKTPDDKLPELVLRPPVVTIMGHVDHGKTLLLDAIRKTNVVDQEAGGITQKIGASLVEWEGKSITFIDTPGHEAFTAMRARGAKVTDIVVLVVAADDGIMPQTVEAINHARAARVPIIVAINKIDVPQANPERVMQQLSDQGLVPEVWGGETVCIPISAKKNIAIDELLEMILLVTELQNLKAEYHRKARGTVIESRIDKGMGPIATVIVQNGTLSVGDSVVVGYTYGKIRAMVDSKGARVKQSTPSTPVEVIGLNHLPLAGDVLYVVDNEKIAKQISTNRNLKRDASKQKNPARATLEELLQKTEKDGEKELNVIIKADEQGAVEALANATARLSNKDIKLNILHTGVGSISETDINLAAASKALILGFNVKPDANTRKLAEQQRVEIKLYNVIYHMLEDLKAFMLGMVEPEMHEVLAGKAEVRTLFKIPKIGIIAGSFVREGKITRGAMGKVIRNNSVIFEGKITSLKRFKDDAREVLAGFECGIGIDRFEGLQEGDQIEVYQMVPKINETSSEKN